MKDLADTIVFDIIDEFTDEPAFATWWWGLPESKREELKVASSKAVSSNIERQAQLDLLKA